MNAVLPDTPAAPPVRRLRLVGTVAVVSLLAILLTIGSCNDTRDRIARVEEFMAGQARGIADVVLHIAADDHAPGAPPQQLGHVVAAMGANLGVRFIDVSGAGGLAVTSPGGAAVRDAAPRAALPGGPPLEYTTPAGAVFEVAAASRLDDGRQVLVRVGLDAEPLHMLRRDITLRSRLRLGVGAAGAALASVLLLSLQRQSVLGREVAKVSRRLARQEEEARRSEKLVAMGALAAGVAHQLRNPLNSIHLLAQALAVDGSLPADARDKVGHIIGETARIDGRIRQFLEFACPREPLSEPVEIDAVVRGVAELQAAARAATGVEIVGYAPSPQTIHTDRGFLVEILENLVRNAVQAGATKIMAALVAAGEYLEITVADNGPGIPAGERERVFDLYYTTRPDGNGLGLSIVSQMAAALGGTVTVADSPGLEGRGARFVVRLPRQRSTA